MTVSLVQTSTETWEGSEIAIASWELDGWEITEVDVAASNISRVAEVVGLGEVVCVLLGKHGFHVGGSEGTGNESEENEDLGFHLCIDCLI